MIEKKEDFYKKIIEEFQKSILSKTMSQSTNLSMDVQKIENQLKLIENIKNNNKEALINFVDRDDELGFEEYHNKIKEYKNTEKFKHEDEYEIFINPSLKFFETDFLDINNENNKINNNNDKKETKNFLKGFSKNIKKIVDEITQKNKKNNIEINNNQPVILNQKIS